MGKTQIITILSAIAIIALLYFGANTVPPTKKSEATTETSNTNNAPAHNHTHTWDTLYAQALSNLSTHGKEEINALETQLAQIKDSLAMASILEKMSDTWLAHKEPFAAGYYKALAAKLVNSEKKLTFAAQFLLELVTVDALPEEGRHWASEEAAKCLERSLQINPNNDTAQLAYAVALIEGKGETMQGVQQLLALTRRVPDHVPANLMLGRMSIQSGQWDKAVSRLETVLKKEPQNREAIFFLAEAYKGQGKKEQGVALLNKLKKMVNDTAFSADIDNYIKTF